MGEADLAIAKSLLKDAYDVRALRRLDIVFQLFCLTVTFSINLGFDSLVYYLEPESEKIIGSCASF